MSKQLGGNIAIAKGLCIILMVVGHSGCPSLLSKFIYIFHMPLFFFFSGFFFNTKKLHPAKDYIKRKVKVLWWPFVKWSTFFLIVHNILYYIYFEKEFFTINEIVKKALLIPLMYGNDPLIGGYWFLNNLFYSIIFIIALSLFMKRFEMNDARISVIATIISVLGFVLSQFLSNVSGIGALSIVVSLFFFNVMLLFRIFVFSVKIF